MARLSGRTVRTLGVAGIALAAGLALGAAAARPTAAGTAVAGAVRASKVSFRNGAPFLIVIQRNDGKNWNDIQAASCQFTQAGVPAPVEWTWTPGDASIHQNTKFVTLKFMARRAIGGAVAAVGAAATAPGPLVSGSLMITVTDAINGQVDTTGTTINVDEMLLDPCPPAAVAPTSGPTQAK